LFHGNGRGVKYGNEIEDMGVELVEALFQGHLTREGDHAVIVGTGIGPFTNHAVAHPQGTGVDPQYSHHTALLLKQLRLFF
jgi:hypothetical protein